tara:strand:+ start:6563 stop:6736 length:174 start_codon:yes stop_codon:yes gene_type:complete
MEKYYRQNDNKGAILNTDKEGLKRYKLLKKKQNEVNELKERVEGIENKLDLILEKLK